MQRFDTMEVHDSPSAQHRESPGAMGDATGGAWGMLFLVSVAEDGSTDPAELLQTSNVLSTAAAATTNVNSNFVASPASSEGAPVSFPLMESSTMFGRFPSCQFVLNDSRISGRHFEIYSQHETLRRSPHSDEMFALSTLASPILRPHEISFWIRDLSTNGTFVNHRRIGKNRVSRIQSGDDIQVVPLTTKRRRNVSGAADNDDDGEPPKYLLRLNFHVFTNNASASRCPSSASVAHHGGGLFPATPPQSSMSSPPLLPYIWPQPTPKVDVSEDAAPNGPHQTTKEPPSLEPPPPPPPKWQWGTKIGSGAQSEVWQGIVVGTGQRIAVKILKDLVAELDKTTASTATARVETDTLQEDPDWDLHNDTAPLSTTSTVAAGTFLLDRSDSIIQRRHTSNATSNYHRVPSSSHQVKLDSSGIRIRKEQQAELRLLQRLRHKRIVQYHGFEVQDGRVCIILEFVAGGSLQTLIREFQGFDESVVRAYSLQILQGLEYLHNNRVVHGDIKPANILVNDKGQIKLTDFGTGKLLRKVTTAASNETPPSEHGDGGGEMEALVGTPLWMSPELIRSPENASFASDIWAFGCVCLEMATGLPPWSEHPEWQREPVAAFFNIGHANSGPSLAELRDASASRDLIEFLEWCFVVDCDHRASASALLRHPFITGRRAAAPAHTAHTLLGRPDAPQMGLPLGVIANSATVATPTPAATAHPKFTDHVKFLFDAEQRRKLLDDDAEQPLADDGEVGSAGIPGARRGRRIESIPRLTDGPPPPSNHSGLTAKMSDVRVL